MKNEKGENFSIDWVSFDDLYNSVAKTNDVEHWLQALRWAKEKVDTL